MYVLNVCQDPDRLLANSGCSLASSQLLCSGDNDCACKYPSLQLDDRLTNKIRHLSKTSQSFKAGPLRMQRSPVLLICQNCYRSYQDQLYHNF